MQEVVPAWFAAICNTRYPRPMYRVAAHVAHVNNAHVDARQRMRSGHYVAYILTDETWYAFDDKVVKALASPPTCFPYIVFLTRVDCAAPKAMVKRIIQPAANIPDATSVSLHDHDPQRLGEKHIDSSQHVRVQSGCGTHVGMLSVVSIANSCLVLCREGTCVSGCERKYHRPKQTALPATVEQCRFAAMRKVLDARVKVLEDASQRLRASREFRCLTELPGYTLQEEHEQLPINQWKKGTSDMGRHGAAHFYPHIELMMGLPQLRGCSNG